MRAKWCIEGCFSSMQRGVVVLLFQHLYLLNCYWGVTMNWTTGLMWTIMYRSNDVQFPSKRICQSIPQGKRLVIQSKIYFSLKQTGSMNHMWEGLGTVHWQQNNQVRGEDSWKQLREEMNIPLGNKIDLAELFKLFSSVSQHSGITCEQSPEGAGPSQKANNTSHVIVMPHIYLCTNLSHVQNQPECTWRSHIFSAICSLKWAPIFSEKNLRVLKRALLGREQSSLLRRSLSVRSKEHLNDLNEPALFLWMLI